MKLGTRSSHFCLFSLLGSTLWFWYTHRDFHVCPWSFLSQCFSFMILVTDFWHCTCFYPFIILYILTEEEPFPLFIILFRAPERISIYWVSIVYKASFSFTLFVPYMYFMKGLLLICLIDKGSEIYKNYICICSQCLCLFLPYGSLYTHSVSFCWSETNITII